ncbi:hypothetical protein HPB52_017067 [Rhipicephalus sanguineus]|uniref:Uncharacterized protein n=1 Tax=Rhipicephalus sanguineus TaxID=34632 RepID=A0A9D4QE70_RHISA|nr:hypothetical protein HPB52_017067 [Rhipicephalus sanguineus]
MDASVRTRLERLAQIVDPYRDTPRRIPATAVRDDAPSPDTPPSPGEGEGVCVGTACEVPTQKKILCCRVMLEVVAEGNNDCITRHADLSSFCLNAAVLEATFYILTDFDVQMDVELHKKLAALLTV